MLVLKKDSEACLGGKRGKGPPREPESSNPVLVISPYHSTGEKVMDFREFDIHNVQNHPDFPRQCGGVWGRKEERGKRTRRQAPAAAVLSRAG